MDNYYYDKARRILYYSINDYEKRSGDKECKQLNTEHILSFDKSQLGELMLRRIVVPNREYRIIL